MFGGDEMKTAIYIEDGAIQLVITPETEFEKNAVSTFRDKQLLVQIKFIKILLKFTNH